MANIAYKRVSTERQETERQFHETNCNFDLVFEDKLSGKNLDRPQLKLCLRTLQKGATLHVWEVSRLSRNLDDLRKTVFDLIDKGISVKFHKEGLEFSGDESNGMKFAMSKMQLNMMGAIEEFNRSLIVERVKEGIAVARSNGVKLGAAAHKEQSLPKELRRQPKQAIGFANQYAGQLLSLRKKGKTYQQISDMFNNMGYKTRTGTEFKPMTVQRMYNRINSGVSL